MSVLIRGMEMPESCVKCRFRSGSCGTFCKALNTWIDDTRGVPKDKRIDNCPLVELPSKHGRLVDCDKLVEKEEKEYLEQDKELPSRGIERLVLVLVHGVVMSTINE